MIKAKYFIGTLVIMGLLVLCLSTVVQGAITFPAAAAAPPYAITVTGNYGSAFLRNVAFEENRTLSPLYSSPVLNAGSVGTTKDFVSPVRVTDRKGVFGSQFTCFLYAPVSFTSCVLTFPVTYFDGTTGTIPLTFTGVGTQNIGGSGVVIKDCRGVTITSLVGTSFRIKVNQSFYGIMWNITRLTDKIDYSLLGYFYNESFTEHDYYMEGSTFTLGVNTGGVGSNMTVENSRLIFFDNPFIRLDSVEPTMSYSSLFNCRRNVRLSILNSTVEVQPSGWCTPPTNIISFGANLITNSVKIEKSRFVTRAHPLGGAYTGAVMTATSYTTVNTPWDINNSFFDGIGFSSCNLRNFKNNIICNLPQKVFYMCAMGDVSNIQVINCRDGFALFQKGFNLTTITFDLYRYLCEVYDGSLAVDESVHLIDCVSNTYAFDEALYAHQYVFWDKHIGVKVQDVDSGGSNLSGVTVRFYNRTGVLKSTQTTDANGNIPSIILSRFRWIPLNGVAIDDTPYNVTFSKSGYQTSWVSLFLADSVVPVNLTVPMDENETVTVNLYENGNNISWTHEYSVSGNVVDVWFNWTNPLVWFFNTIHATVVHGNSWTGSQMNLYVNTTGNSSGPSASPLSIINPNPGNGSHQTNYIKEASNLTTSVDVSMKNFTIFNGSSLGESSLFEYQDFSGNELFTVDWYPYIHAQEFQLGHVGTHTDIVLSKINLSLDKLWLSSNQTFKVTIKDELIPGAFDNDISVGTLWGGDMIQDHQQEYTINMTPVVLLKDKTYYICYYTIRNPGETEYSVNIYGQGPPGCGTYPGGMFMVNFTKDGWITIDDPPMNMYDIYFKLYGWGIVGNMTWDDIINLTWSSNSSGAWLPYAYSTVMSNGTVTVPAVNFSGVGKYFWKVEAESNHTTFYNTSVFEFTTVGNPVCNSTDLTVNEFNTNVTGGYTTLYNPLTGWIVNNSYTGNTTPIHTSDIMYRCTGSLLYVLNSTGYWVTSNHIGNQSGIVLNDMSHDVTGSLTYWWSDLTGVNGEWLVNDTHAGVGGGAEDITVINPNPGYGGFGFNASPDGSHDTNHLVRKASGLTNSVDVIGNNFTIPPAVVPGEYSMTIIGSEPDNTPVVWNTSTTGVYMDVHDDNTGQITPGNPYVGQYELAGEYTIMRSFLVFNTSSIPDGAIINSGYVKLYVYDVDYTVDDFDVIVQQTRRPIPHFPVLVAGDYWDHGFTGDLGNTNTTSYNDNDVFNIVLNASGIFDILGGDWKLTDSVRWCLRSSQDDNASAPVDDAFIIFYGYGVDTSKHPRLIINYTIPASNWAHIVNLTWYDNHTGVWLQNNKTHVNCNGTVTVDQVNFTGNRTYCWNVTWESNHTNNGSSQVWTFTTLNTTGGSTGFLPLGVGDSGVAMSLAVILIFGLLVMLVSVRRKRKKKT